MDIKVLPRNNAQIRYRVRLGIQFNYEHVSMDAYKVYKVEIRKDGEILETITSIEHVADSGEYYVTSKGFDTTGQYFDTWYYTWAISEVRQTVTQDFHIQNVDPLETLADYEDTMSSTDEEIRKLVERNGKLEIKIAELQQKYNKASAKCGDLMLGCDFEKNGEKYAARPVRLDAELAKVTHYLKELLAVIHRDGGHYVAQFGLEKSVIAARVKSSKRITEVVEVREGYVWGFCEDGAPKYIQGSKGANEGCSLVTAEEANGWVAENQHLKEVLRKYGGHFEECEFGIGKLCTCGYKQALIEKEKKIDHMDEALQLAAQCWCDPETEDRIMDVPLAKAVAKRIAMWMDTAAQNQRNADYYRGLVERCGEAIGAEAYIADDGGRVPDVLCNKALNWLNDL